MNPIEYNGFVARTEIDVDSNLIFGEVIGSRDVITFQGETVAEAVRAFHESVDLYLDICREHGLAAGPSDTSGSRSKDVNGQAR